MKSVCTMRQNEKCRDKKKNYQKSLIQKTTRARTREVHNMWANIKRIIKKTTKNHNLYLFPRDEIVLQTSPRYKSHAGLKVNAIVHFLRSFFMRSDSVARNNKCHRSHRRSIWLNEFSTIFFVKAKVWLESIYDRFSSWKFSDKNGANSINRAQHDKMT